jgi:putative peptidoglycan lipid II flippase
VLVVANGVEGGVVAHQLAFTVFLLPHAVVALPVATALYPVLARGAADAGERSLAAATGNGLTAVVLLTAPGAAALVALADPLARLLAFGAASGGVDQIAGAIAGFGPGLVGYGALVLLTRAAYAAGDTRTPAVVHAGILVGGAAAMAVVAAVVGVEDRVPWLAAVHSAAHLVGAVVLLVRLAGRRGRVRRPAPHRRPPSPAWR